MKYIIKRYKEDIFEISTDQEKYLKKQGKNLSEDEIIDFIENEGKHIELIDSGFDEKEPCLKYEDVYKK
tara:strand:+ start:55 stop:261 length:207 start_codon:yes stop_codon:yes gene_type:complete